MTGEDAPPVEFGIFDIMQVPPETPSYRAYNRHLDDAELADQLGLDYHFIAERHFMALYRTPSPTAWLGAMSQRTKRIRIGALAYTVPMHNPIRLAEEISMLDHLSGGRIEAGVGLGHRPEELASLGIDPALRHPMLVESLVVMRKAWLGETFDHPGTAFAFRGVRVDVPVQLPHPPLWYAGNDPRAAGWCARNLVSLAIGFQSDEQLANPANAFHEQKREDKRAPERRPYLALMRHLYIAESNDQAREEMIADLRRIGAAFAAGPRELPAIDPADLPDRDEAEAQLDQLLENDVVIGGDPETCAEKIAETSRRLGLNVFLANPYLTGLEPERVQRTVRLFANETAPCVRALLN
jgi:alkanesulfonate monooxygenase SsuD/methylene tetrahydromethanopterin reductase-like flavin-dependent oxidoreductase (luciferase family)